MMTQKQQGFSLLELLVVMIISLLLLLGIAQVYTSQATSYRWQQEKARLQEDARLAAYLLHADLLPASQIDWSGDRLNIVLPEAPQPLANAFLGRSLGEWYQPGNSDTRQIRNPSVFFTGLVQNSCIWVEGQLYRRQNNPGGENSQGVITFHPSNPGDCNNPESDWQDLRLMGDQLVISPEQLLTERSSRQLSFSVNDQGELIRQDKAGKEVAWLDSVLAFEVQVLYQDQYQDIKTLTLASAEWRQVPAVRLGLLLQSPQALPGGQARDLTLLSDTSYICAAGHSCLPFVTTLRLRNNHASP